MAGKLNATEIEVESFDVMPAPDGGMSVLANDETFDFWQCASIERCYASHPYQKMCV